MYNSTIETAPFRTCDYKLIAKQCNSTDVAIQYTLRQLGMAIESAMKMRYTVKLNMRIGWLKFSDGNFFFDNLASAQCPNG